MSILWVSCFCALHQTPVDSTQQHKGCNGAVQMYGVRIPQGHSPSGVLRTSPSGLEPLLAYSGASYT